MIPAGGGTAQRLHSSPTGRWSIEAEWVSSETVRIVSDEEKPTTFLINALTGKRTNETNYLPNLSPDKKHAIRFPEENKAEIVSLKDGKVTPLPGTLHSVLWRTNTLLVGIDGDAAKSTALLFDLTGSVVRRIPLKLSPEAQKYYDENEEFPGFYHPSQLPDGRFLVAGVDGDSTFGHWYVFHVVNLQTGIADRFASGGGLYWSPKMRQYITTMGHDYAPYGRWSDERGERTVDVCPLYIGSAKHPTKPRQLVSGLVYVNGCDWRGGSVTR